MWIGAVLLSFVAAVSAQKKPDVKPTPPGYGTKWICDENPIWRCAVRPKFVPGDFADLNCFYWADIIQNGLKTDMCKRPAGESSCGNVGIINKDPLIEDSRFLVYYDWQRKPGSTLQHVRIVSVSVNYFNRAGNNEFKCTVVK